MEYIRELSTFLPEVMAMFLAYVAWQQYQVNRTKIKMALLERRFEVWDSLIVLLDEVARSRKVSEDTFWRLKGNLRSSFFLFGNDVEKYLDKVLTNASEIMALSDSYGHEKTEENRLKNIDRRALLTKWFLSQHFDAKLKFSKYMRITWK